MRILLFAKKAKLFNIKQKISKKSIAFYLANAIIMLTITKMKVGK
ncbi:hypothetical protein RV12_GL000633 [Enterococcus quebecensis]|nr:hypothetical protein RV12_GL000633 [Enterococcus quebecensis]